MHKQGGVLGRGHDPREGFPNWHEFPAMGVGIAPPLS